MCLIIACCVRVHTRSEINNQIGVFVRYIDIKLPDDVLIISIPYQTIDIMRTLEIAVIAVDDSSIVN